MIGLLCLAAGVCIGYVICIFLPPMKPKEIVHLVPRAEYDELMKTRALPEHNLASKNWDAS